MWSRDLRDSARSALSRAEPLSSAPHTHTPRSSSCTKRLWPAKSVRVNNTAVRKRQTPPQNALAVTHLNGRIVFVLKRFHEARTPIANESHAREPGPRSLGNFHRSVSDRKRPIVLIDEIIFGILQHVVRCVFRTSAAQPNNIQITPVQKCP